MSSSINEDRQSVEGQEAYKRLRGSTFKQNRFFAWRPSRSPNKNGSIFVAFGVLFLVIGIVLLVVSRAYVEYSFHYSGESDEIDLEADFVKELVPPVYVYYEITELHQNYRRFAYSKSNAQLSGKYKNYTSEVMSCYPIYTESDRLGNSSSSD
ncbi:MAG: hypothetical protein P4M11_10785 [Candidatus Pacebacteria bacterium]|nr:hypothetical protein [Candidatus Paceibacterota bacterium]